MRRIGAFFTVVFLILWMTPALFAGDSNGDHTAALTTDSLSTQPAETTPAAPVAKKAEAPIFSINSFYVFYTTAAKPDAVFGYGTTSHDLLTFQFEHFSFHPWGDLYVDAEVYQGRNVGTPFADVTGEPKGNNWQSLIVLNPRMSLSKVSKKKIAWGPRKFQLIDVSIATRFERESYPAGDNFWTRNFGPSLNFKVPGFAWFETGLLARYDNIDQKNTYLWRSVLLSTPWKIRLGPVTEKFHFDLLSLINGSTGHGNEIFERADVGMELPHYPRIHLGIRTEVENYNHDPLSAGINPRYKRVMPEAMVKYTF